MSIHITPIKTETYIPPTVKEEEEEERKPEEKPVISSKTLAVSLTALGVASLALLALKNKKKSTPMSEIKKFAGKNLSEEEKEKLIKELQTKTDNPDVKAEIRKLIENGEWDKL